MQKKDALSKVFAVFGTALVWLPIIAPAILGFVSLVMDGIFRFDYLMPAELGVVVFTGGALLIIGALRTRVRKKITSWGFGLAAGSIAILMALGDVVPGSFEWGIAIGLLVTYSLAIVVMGIAGLLLCRDLFGNPDLNSAEPV